MSSPASLRRIFDQLVGQIERVVDAAVHAHRADRAVHVGGIAGEDRAAGAELLRDALVHRIEIAADDLEVMAGRNEALQPRLQGFGTLQGLGILVLRGREMHAPAIRRALQWNRFDHSSGSEM